MATAVLTRDDASAQAYAEALAPLGLDSVALPVTRTVDADAGDLAALAAAARQPWDGLLVASARAVGPLVQALDRGPPPLHVVAVGPATAAALAAHGLAATSADRDGVAAADRLIAAGCRRVLIPRAAGGRDDAIERLRAAGVEVAALTAYRTAAASPEDPDVAGPLELVATGRAAVVGLFAPSQVDALEALLAARGASLDVLAVAVVAAIGATTAAALAGRGVRVDAVADRPEPAAMARAVAAVYPRGP